MSKDAPDKNAHAVAVIDALGGTTKLAELIEAPISTVQSWKYIGIPASRMAHLRMIAKARRTTLPDAPAGEQVAA